MTTSISHRNVGRPVQPAELFERLSRDRDGSARNELIERFLPLARKLARRYVRSSESYDDLVQVASVGLVKAVDRFDPARGHAFTSYAVPTIVGELKRHFRDLGWTLHVERGLQERARAVLDAESTIAARSGQPPTIDELAQYLEYSLEDVIDALAVAATRTPMSLDAPVTVAEGEAPVSRSEVVGRVDERLALADDRTTLTAAAQQLPELERRILYLRFGADLTQTEIAEIVGVSQMHVSRLLRRSLGRLRELLG
jgi:RNA polymerase sigma-B factor